MDFVRYQVAEGKELTEIGEMMCDHCLAPDTTSGAGIGCDNMTVLIVAITHGRTKEEWYEWIKDRVKNEYGYKTPSSVPQLYAQSRLLSFRARREAQEARERTNPSSNDTQPASAFDTDDFLRRYGLTVTTLTGGGGVSFRSGGIANDNRDLMFANDDSDEEDESGDEHQNTGASFFTETLGLGRSDSPDLTKNLRAQLDEFEKDNDSESTEVDKDGDSKMSEQSGELRLYNNFRI